MAFPTTLDTDVDLHQVINNLSTTLNASYTTPATTVTLVDTSAFPTTGGIIYIAGERGTYTGISGNDLTGLVGIGGNYSIGATCEMLADAAHHNDIKDAVKSLQAKVGIDSSADTGSIDYILDNKPDLSATPAVALGTASAGVAGASSRQDHVHPTTGLVKTTDIGTTVQTQDDQLDDIAGLVPTDNGIIIGNSVNFVIEAGATARASLGLAIGINVQAQDAQLDDVAGLTPTNNGVIIGNGANLVVESGTTLRTSLGLAIGVDVAAEGHNHTGVYEPADGTIVKDADIGVTVQAYDVDTSKLDVAETRSAQLGMGDNNLIDIKTASFNIEYDNGNSGAADTVTFSNGQKQKSTLTANTTLTITAPAAGDIGNYQLRLIQDVTGGRVVTWSGLSASRWLSSAAAPAINAAANGETIISLFWDGANFTQSASKVGAA